MAKSVIVNNNKKTTARLCHHFPTFLWLLRDFSLKLPNNPATNQPMTPQQFLLNRVLHVDESNSELPEHDEVRMAILNFFPSLDCFTLPIPSADSQVMQDISSRHEELNPIFKAEINELISYLKSNIQIKRGFFSSDPIDSKTLAVMIQEYLNALNKPGSVPCLDDTWQAVSAQRCEAIQKELVEEYKTTMIQAIAEASQGLPLEVEATEIELQLADGTIMGIHQNVYSKLQQVFLAKIGQFVPGTDDGTRAQHEEYVNKFEHQIVQYENGDLKGGVLHEFCNENYRKSEIFCEKKWHELYEPIHSKITSTESCSFHQYCNDLDSAHESFIKLARGPAKWYVLEKVNKTIEQDKIHLKRLADYDARLDKHDQEAREFRDKLRKAEEELNAERIQNSRSITMANEKIEQICKEMERQSHNKQCELEERLRQEEKKCQELTEAHMKELAETAEKNMQIMREEKAKSEMMQQNMLSKLEEERQELERQSTKEKKELEMKIQKQQDELQEKANRCFVLEVTTKEMKKNIIYLEKAQEELKQNNDNEKREHKQQVNKMQKEIQEKEKILLNIKDETQKKDLEYQKQLMTVENEKKLLEDKYKNIETENEEVKAQYEKEKQVLAEKENDVKRLEGEVNENKAKQEHLLNEKKEAERYQRELEEQYKLSRKDADSKIEQLKAESSEKNKELETLEQQLTNEREIANEKIMAIERERDTALEEKDTALEERDTALEERDTALNDKKIAVDDKNKAVDERNKAVDDKNKAIDDKNKAVDDKNKAVDDKNKAVDDKNKLVDDKNKAVDDKNKAFEQRDAARRVEEDLRNRSRMISNYWYK